jgi:exosome complex RNA-binding protein Csl4
MSRLRVATLGWREPRSYSATVCCAMPALGDLGLRQPSHPARVVEQFSGGDIVHARILLAGSTRIGLSTASN